LADRKHGEEPSLFDLPLRRKPGEEETAPGRSSNTGQEAERGAGANADGGQEAGDPPQEPAFWETEPDADADAGAAPAPAPDPIAAPGTQPRAAGPTPDLSEGADWADLEAGGAAVAAPSGEPGDGDPGEASDTSARPAAVPATLTHRLAASLLDGGVLLVVTAGAILGAFLLGVRWDADDLPALGMFLLVFSFVYSVMPLAFWGRTPGMALARVLSRGADGGPLTFGQTALRWLAGLVTVALAGLPLLLSLPALGGRSLADRLSGSHTWSQPDA